MAIRRVGIQHVAAYLVTTNEGLVLIDATYAETADMVLDNIRKLKFVQLSQSVQHFASTSAINPLGIAQVQNRVTNATQLHTLMLRWQKSAAPQASQQS